MFRRSALTLPFSTSRTFRRSGVFDKQGIVTRYSGGQTSLTQPLYKMRHNYLGISRSDYTTHLAYSYKLLYYRLLEVYHDVLVVSYIPSNYVSILIKRETSSALSTQIRQGTLTVIAYTSRHFCSQ